MSDSSMTVTRVVSMPIVALCASLGGLTVPTLASAQQQVTGTEAPASAVTPVLNEVVVTATKREQAVIDVPAAVDVFTHDSANPARQQLTR